MAQPPSLHPPVDQRPQARRLSSFTQITRAFNRRRGTGFELPMLSRTTSIKSKVDVPTAPTTARPRISSPHARKPGLPRSSTISNLPRIPTTRYLPTSTSSISLLPSRIPTPNGTRLRPTGIIYTGEGIPSAELTEPVVSSTTSGLAAARKPGWGRSLGPEMIMPQVDRDGSVPLKASSRDKELPKLPRERGNMISRKPLPKTVDVEKPANFVVADTQKIEKEISAEDGQWPLADQTNSLDESDAADLGGLLFHPTITRTSPIKEENSDTEPLITPENRKPRRSSEIVHRGLLRGVGPAVLSTPGAGATTVSSSPARRNYRMLSSDTLLGSRTSPTLKSRFKATFGKKQQDLSPTNSTHSLGISDEEDSILDPGIYEAQPSAYWSGRWISLNDAILNDAILNDVEGEVPLPSLDKDTKALVAQKENNRTLRVFAALEGCCKTPAAKRSLWAFQIQLAERRNMPELITNVPQSLRDKAKLPRHDGRKDAPTAKSKSKPRLTMPRKAGSGSFGSQNTLGSTLASGVSETSLGTTKSGFIGRLMDMKRKSSWGGSSG